MSVISFPPSVSSSSCCSAMAIMRNVEVAHQANRQAFVGIQTRNKDEWFCESQLGVRLCHHTDLLAFCDIFPQDCAMLQGYGGFVDSVQTSWESIRQAR